MIRRDLAPSLLAVVLLTIALGLVYPLAITGVAQVAFPGKADGSRVERDGVTVGSSLIAQGFGRDPAYFHPRPSQTDYSANVTAFSNAGPNSRALRDAIARRARRYVGLEGRYVPGGLDVADVPVDAVTTSGSGVDPHISPANARLQAHRVAAERGLDLERVEELADEHTAGRALGFLGEPAINVLELNLALDEAAP